LENLISKNKAGKAVMSLPKGSQLLTPAHYQPGDWIAVVTDEPRLLVFDSQELPELAKGKGNKLIQLPKNCQVTAVFAFTPGKKLELVAGDYAKAFGGSAIEEAFAGRAKRGIPLPRTLKKCTKIRIQD